MDEQTRQSLEMTFSRGFTGGYLHDINHQEVVEGRFPKKRGLYLGRVAAVDGRGVTVRLEEPLKPGDGVVFDAGTPEEDEEGGRVYELWKGGDRIPRFEPSVGRARGIAVTLAFGSGRVNLRRVRPGDRVWKTSDPEIDRALCASYTEGRVHFRRPVWATVSGAPGAPLQLRLRDEDGVSVEIADVLPAESAEKHALDEGTLRQQLSRLGGTPFELAGLDVAIKGHVMVPFSRLNELRRRAVDALVSARRARGAGRSTHPGALAEMGTVAENGRPQDTVGCGTGVSPVSDRRPVPADGVVVRQGAYLPHWTKDATYNAVVFRLADSLPASVVEAYREERELVLRAARQENRELTDLEREALQRLFSERVERTLDAGVGSCWMRTPEIADLVESALRHFDGVRYDLLAWCVMPNHVHVLVRPKGGYQLAAVLHSWKSFTAHRANRSLGTSGEFWQPEYYDHLIRDAEELRRQADYIWRNPEAAGLPEWRWRGISVWEADGGTDNRVEDRSSGQSEEHATAAFDHGRDARATSGRRVPELASGQVAQMPSAPTHASLSVLCRSLEQVEAAVAAGGIGAIHTDFEDVRTHREARRLVPAGGPRFIPATLRVMKPGEAGIVRKLLEAQPDALLVRNLGGWRVLRDAAPALELLGDYSLNVANDITARILMERGLRRLTPSYDLNMDQLLDLLRAAPPEWFEVTIHQHLPMFHMEHCVFCRFLSTGTDWTNCGRPCETHTLALRDRMGYEHPVKADAGCRNTRVQRGCAERQRIPRRDAGCRRAPLPH